MPVNVAPFRVESELIAGGRVMAQFHIWRDRRWWLCGLLLMSRQEWEKFSALCLNREEIEVDEQFQAQANGEDIGA
jgi:hypothetical protein